MTNQISIQFPHVEEKYAPAEKVQVRFELCGDYVSIGLGEDGDRGFKETTGTMIGLEQFKLAAEMLVREFHTQEARRHKKSQSSIEKTTTPPTEGGEDA